MFCLRAERKVEGDSFSAVQISRETWEKLHMGDWVPLLKLPIHICCGRHPSIAAWPKPGHVEIRDPVNKTCLTPDKTPLDARS